MECVKSGGDLAATPRPKAAKSSRAKKVRVARSDPPTRLPIGSVRAAEFALFDDAIRNELNPRSPLERLITNQVIQSAWHLKGSLDRKLDQGQKESPESEVEKTKGRSSASADRSGRSLRDALESLDYLRSRQTSPTRFMPSIETEIEPNEWPIVPTDGLDDFLNDSEPIEDETPDWRDRLVFDFEVSDISPVIKGTWITVGHVVSLIVDGWTWADILRSHPELSEDDIRTCIAYAMAEENSAD